MNERQKTREEDMKTRLDIAFGVGVGMLVVAVPMLGIETRRISNLSSVKKAAKAGYTIVETEKQIAIVAKIFNK